MPRLTRTLAAALTLTFGLAAAPLVAQQEAPVVAETPGQPPPASTIERGQMGSMVTPIEPLPFRSDLERRRFKALTSELRCTVCQNEALSESTAPLARDIRMEVFAMLQEGSSDFEIRNFMVERYGDFVLYRPPLAGHTILLWAGPLLLLAGGLMGAVFVVIKRRRAL
ncbi:MAG: cytochrome c-type biogenesis protein [Wenzhouxiangella sp.]|jgi:cytochrome c-type biogenesis protein CcmH|nr:cytochrome c-type biogenesis protein [Wenzhouxiangella sp.]